MLRLTPYLQHRGSGFTFRISVPSELRNLIGARALTKALSETNHEAASPTALEFVAAAKRLFCEVQAKASRSQGMLQLYNSKQPHQAHNQLPPDEAYFAALPFAQMPAA